VPISSKVLFAIRFFLLLKIPMIPRTMMKYCRNPVQTISVPGAGTYALQATCHARHTLTVRFFRPASARV